MDNMIDETGGYVQVKDREWECELCSNMGRDVQLFGSLSVKLCNNHINDFDRYAYANENIMKLWREYRAFGFQASAPRTLLNDRSRLFAEADSLIMTLRKVAEDWMRSIWEADKGE